MSACPQDGDIAAVAEGLVPQGRQVLAFQAERLDAATVSRLVRTHGAVGMIGAEPALTRRLPLLRRLCDSLVTGRLVMAGAPEVFQRCRAVVAQREQDGPVPALCRLDGDSPADHIAAIQRGLGAAGLTPLPDDFLRGRSLTRSVTLMAMAEDGQVLGSSTVHELAPDRLDLAEPMLFSCALWIAADQQKARLGGWLYAASVLAARDAFTAAGLWTTVAATNAPVISMLARCGIHSDPGRGFVGLRAAPALEPGA